MPDSGGVEVETQAQQTRRDGGATNALSEKGNLRGRAAEGEGGGSFVGSGLGMSEGLGVNTGTGTTLGYGGNMTPESMMEGPLYQAALESGMNAMNATSSAKGHRLSGKALIDANEFGGSLLNQMWQDENTRSLAWSADSRANRMESETNRITGRVEDDQRSENYADMFMGLFDEDDDGDDFFSNLFKL